MKKPVISRRNIPVRLPVTNTLLMMLIIDYYSLPEWSITLIILWLALTWLVAIIVMFKEKSIDFFKNYKDPEEERLDNIKPESKEFFNELSKRIRRRG